MKQNSKKMIAPILITVIFVLYLVFYFTVLLSVLDGVLRLLLLIIPIGLIVLMIAVCVERIKEIKGGEENDISKY